MSFPNLPTAIQQKCLGFLWDTSMDLEEPNSIKLVLWLTTIRLVNKLFYRIIKPHYEKWQPAIENNDQTPEGLKRKYGHYKASPLLNALLTHYEPTTIVNPTFDTFTQGINRDILAMIECDFLDLPHPQPEEISTLLFSGFFAKCLVAACYNDHVPISTVEKLLGKMTCGEFATEEITRLYETLQQRKSVTLSNIAYVRDRNLRLRSLLLERAGFSQFYQYISKCTLL